MLGYQHIGIFMHMWREVHRFRVECVMPKIGCGLERHVMGRAGPKDSGLADLDGYLALNEWEASACDKAKELL